jgi:hypothetical protein
VNLRKVRRLAGVLVASQLRSGRSTSDPKSLLGQPIIVAIADVGLFLIAFLVLTAALSGSLPAAATWRSFVGGLLPFLPLGAVGVVLVAGTSFELMSNARFAGSDAANWMPVTPSEYVAASASAIAYTYSPAIALALGGVLPLALAAGLVPVYLLTALLCVVSLVEGAFLVEMVRAASNRAGSVGSGRRGAATLVARALAIVFALLVLDLALNPLILLAAIDRLSAFPTIAAAIPLVWSSRALAGANAGDAPAAAAFTAGQIVFVVLLALVAGELRRRYWVPSPSEIRLGEHRYAAAHPVLAGLGLNRSESALVGKDLRGIVRRREMLPFLTVPVVLVLLLAIEGSSFGTFGLLLWVGWVAGFFGLLLAATSVGQERRGLQLLFAFPVTARSIFRAKAASVLIPVLIGVVAMTVGVGLWFHFALSTLAGAVLLTATVSVVLVLWGLVFASRYSDFQERPRPQFVRPGAMIVATLSGLVLLSAIVVPAAYVLSTPSPMSDALVLVAFLAAAVGGIAAYLLARAGFDRLFRELPF